MTTTTPPSTVAVLLTPAQVAGMFRVNPKTVSRWAGLGKLSAQRTLGGHLRFDPADVRRLLADARSGLT